MTRMKSRFLALLVVLLSPMAANADPITYDISVSGAWFDTFGNPYGMELSPTLTGSMTVDNSLSGIAALIDFSLTTGTRTWTENDIYQDAFPSLDEFVFDAFGELTRFSLGDFLDGFGGSMGIYSNNTFSVRETSSPFVFNACNGCVSFSRSVTTVPEPGTFALLGFGLAAIGLARRRTRV